MTEYRGPTKHSTTHPELVARAADPRPPWRARRGEDGLDGNDRQRRRATLEAIEQQSIRNKRNLESDGIAFGQELRHIAADRDRTYEYLLRVSMIASLRAAAELRGIEP